MRPRFGTSYSIGIKDGWISYLYSTRPLTDPTLTTSSDQIPLQNLLQCYRELSTRAVNHAVGHSLVYGRLYLPQNSLEALVACRVSRQVNLSLRAVSQERLRHGATLLGLAQWDDPNGRFGVETLASSDGGVLGLRGLWNVTNPASPAGGPPEPPAALPPLPPPPPEDNNRERINGRFSVGGEIYYGLLNKSGGMSIGGRFQTLPTHAGTPLAATLTFNLLGHMSATYTVQAGDCTLASMFGFNVYSYESEWAVGMELWRKRGPLAPGAAMDEDEGAEAAAEAGIAEAALKNMDEMNGIAKGELVDRKEVDPTSMAAMTPLEPTDTTLISTTTTPAPSVSPPNQPAYRERSFQAKLEWRLDGNGDNSTTPEETYDPTTGEKITKADEPEDEISAGVLKCRCDLHMRLGLLYESRYKSLLFSLGSDIDLKRLDAPFRGVGLAVQFSS